MRMREGKLRNSKSIRMETMIGSRPLIRKDEWMVEELIIGQEGATIPANDLKFFCFYGEVLFVFETNRWVYKQSCHWDVEMNQIKTGRYDEQQTFKGSGFTKKDLDTIISVSLQIPSPFVRLDMLKGIEGLVFGEATPRTGKFQLFNEEYDRKLGEAYRRAEARILRDLLNCKKFEAFTSVFNV